MGKRLSLHERLELMQKARILTERQGLSQRVIATMLGVSQPTICQWLQRGDLGTIQQQVAEKIRAELVCCDIYQRMEDAYDPEDDSGWKLLRHSRDYHDICFYGEWAARIAEGIQ